PGTLAAGLQRVYQPRPIRRLLGEDAGMAERPAGGCEVHAERLVAHLPALRDWPVVLPLPGAAVGPDLAAAAGPAPARRLQPPRPERVRLGTVERDRREALELAAVAAVEQFVVTPFFGREQIEQLGGHSRVSS